MLFGHCEEDLAAPYQLFTEALGHFVAHAPEDQLADARRVVGAGAGPVGPGVVERLPGLEPSTATDADTGRYQLFAAVVELLADGVAGAAGRVGAGGPAVGGPGQPAVAASRRRLDQPMRLLVFGHLPRHASCRAPTRWPTRWPTLHRLGGVTRVELAGLDDAGVASFMEAAAGHALDDTAVRLARAVHRETDGNPFFVSEVLRHLAETGALSQDAATAAGSPQRRSTRCRCRRASHGDRRTCRTARPRGRTGAVAGRGDRPRLRPRPAHPRRRLADDDVLDILDAATAAALVRELTDTPGHYSFVHALIQHTLYEELGRTRQARAHRQVAEALEASCGDRPGSRVGELARHWSAAPQPDALAKALDYTRRAADDALAALAPGDALGYYTQALDLYAQSADPDPLLGIDLRIGLGIAQRQTGHAEFRDTLLDAARPGRRPRRHRPARRRRPRQQPGHLLRRRHRRPRPGRHPRARPRRVPGDHPSRPSCSPPCAPSSPTPAAFNVARPSPTRRSPSPASTGDDATIVRVLNNVSFPLAMPQLLAQSLEWSAEALQRAERLGDPVLLFWAAHVRALHAISAGDIAEMERCFEIAWSLAERLDQPISAGSEP